VRHLLIKTGELGNPCFARNPENRCFYCKDELFRTLTRLAKQHRMTLCDATNYSDRTDFRPGRKAALKWKVASPLLKAKMTKDDIRAFSKTRGLPTWNQPAQACLASRFPYGTAITAAELRRIEKAESFIRALGFPLLRLRHHGEIARLEVAKDSLATVTAPAASARIVACLKRLGWRYITVDLEGYRTGSLNRPKK
jgi:uncharacterized protein